VDLGVGIGTGRGGHGQQDPGDDPQERRTRRLGQRIERIGSYLEQYRISRFIVVNCGGTVEIVKENPDSLAF